MDLEKIRNKSSTIGLNKQYKTQSFRGILRTQSNIQNKAFCEVS